MTKISTFGLIYLRFAVLVYNHIRDLWRTRRYLDLNGAKLSGMADTDVAKRQRVQNRLARVVTKSPPFTCIVALLHSLHWLPTKFRIDFKICLLTYKILSEKQPVYLHSLLATPLPSRSLISHKGISLSVPRVRPMLGLVPLLFGTACRCQSVHPLQFPPAGNIFAVEQ